MFERLKQLHSFPPISLKEGVRYLFHQKNPYETWVRLKGGGVVSGWSLEQLKYRKERVEEDLYLWELKGKKWLANMDQIHGLYEYLQGEFDIIYRTNYWGKRVLDIGGYIGDSALYALERGASGVTIYEPVEKNRRCLSHNLAHYATKIQVVAKAVDALDGGVELFSETPMGHVGFGFSKGQYSLHVEAESFETILLKNPADIAKVDCEGGERHLLTTPDPLLRKIPLWMIETHSHTLFDLISQKFIGAGFTLRKTSNSTNSCATSHFLL